MGAKHDKVKKIGQRVDEGKKMWKYFCIDFINNYGHM
jgi:hypothetical protein